MSEHRKFYVRTFIAILVGMIIWNLFLWRPFEIEDQERAQAHSNLDIVNASLQQYLYEHGKWPSTSDEIPTSNDRLKDLLRKGLLQCFVPLDKNNENSVIVGLINKDKALYVLLFEGKHMEKKIEQLPIKFDGYILLK